jgi:uncharacterized membrane protein YeaQ/YmgE (transglycosylase-associated protein family)
MELYGLLSWVALGLVAGLVAQWLTTGRLRAGCLATTLLGVVGAILGGFLATWLEFGGISGFDWRSVLVAILGSVLVLLLAELAKRR